MPSDEVLTLNVRMTPEMCERLQEEMRLRTKLVRENGEWMLHFRDIEAEIQAELEKRRQELEAEYRPRGRPWVGVDLDGTLAVYSGWDNGAIGEPIPRMVERVKTILASGIDVVIVTARWHDGPIMRERVREWCEEHIGQRLDVTAAKDYSMIYLLDDRAIAVEQNTGRVLRPAEAA